MPSFYIAGNERLQGAVFGNPIQPNNTALDGSATAQALTVNLSTTFGNDLICCMITINPTGSTTPTVSSPNLGAFTFRSSARGTQTITSNDIQFHYAIAPATPLSTELITISAGSPGFIEVIVFGVTGVKTGTNNGFDTNVALPNFQNTSGPVSITTSNANDFLLSAYRDSGPIGPALGWTQIANTAAFTLVQYKIVTATQNPITVSDPDTAGACVGDALVST